MKKRFHVTYNAPVTITFALISAFILVLNLYVLNGHLIPAFFTVPGNRNATFAFDWTKLIDYIRLFTHVFGHSGWNHYLSNFAFILLLGPLMEERYGSAMLSLMILVTTFVTGIINVCFIPTPLLGASGIAFMLIILASINKIEKNEIPLSFILVLAIYVGREIYGASSTKNISTVAHLVGGACGSLFGFLLAPKPVKNKKISSQNKKARLEEIDNNSPRFKNNTSQKNSVYSDEDSTIVGTIKL